MTEKQEPAIELKQREALAFAIYHLSFEVEWSDAQNEWRSNADIRDKYRAMADTFQTNLGVLGLKVESGDIRKITKAIAELTTHPARPAYQL